MANKTYKTLLAVVCLLAFLSMPVTVHAQSTTDSESSSITHKMYLDMKLGKLHIEGDNAVVDALILQRNIPITYDYIATLMRTPNAFGEGPACIVCHSSNNPDKSYRGLDLSSCEGILRGATESPSRPVIHPGQSTNNLIVHMLQNNRMPLGVPFFQNIDTPAINSIRDWIDAGAKDDEVFKALSDMPKANFSRQRNIELSDSLKRYIDLDKENISQRVFYDSLFSAMNEEVCFNPDHKFIRFYFLSKSYKTLRTKWRLADNISNKENKKKQVFFCDQKLKIAKKVSTGCGDSLLNDGYLIQEGEGFGCLVEGQKGLVKVNDFSPNSLSIETSGTYGDDAYLVYGDGYSKVWEVLVDGIPSNIAKINYAYKGVGIDSGSHMVNFKIKNHLVYLLYFKNLLLACLMIVAFLYFTRRVNK